MYAEAEIDIQTDEGERVEVRSRSRAWSDRDMFWGSVSVDGCLVFERSWRSGGIPGDRTHVGYAARSSAPNRDEGATG